MVESRKRWKLLYREQIKTHSCYCYLCGKPIEQEKELSLDHCVPLSRGGRNDPTNWMPSHKTCNSEKGALTYEEWLLYQTLLKRKHGNTK